MVITSWKVGNFAIPKLGLPTKSTIPNKMVRFKIRKNDF